MSQFLGPIHYWLYSKIENQENLTKSLEEYGKNQEWIAEESQWTKEFPPLESAIDEGDIHGWLQEEVRNGEIRWAKLVTELIKEDESRWEEIKEVAYDFGVRHPFEEDENPEAIYRQMENFFVNGMPCDHVNMVMESNPQGIMWKQTQDLHKEYWREVGGDPKQYYTLRENVIEGMLSNTGYTLENVDVDLYRLAKK